MLVDVIRRVLFPAGLLLAALMAGCSTAPPKVPFPLGTADRNLTYCNSQTLDLYIPRAAVTRPLPVAIYVHGGGMTAGDKSDLNPVFLDALASAGYAVASVNYRLAPQFKFPAQIEDVKCAIRYLRAKAPKYGLNGREIFAFGTSVGGQVVALAALTGPHSAFDVGPYATEPSNLIAVADMFGPANLTQRASGFSPSGIQQVFGTNDHPDLALASPTHFVAPNSPPILLIQGADDTKVLKSQSIELYRDLKAAGDHTQLVLVQNMGHMFTHAGPKPLNPSLQQIAKDVTSFFDNERKV
ncbi:MAG: alpha/beta hydrolase fold domain-containing protein [Streptosporangiaceae bacterium]